MSNSEKQNSIYFRDFMDQAKSGYIPPSQLKVIEGTINSLDPNGHNVVDVKFGNNIYAPNINGGGNNMMETLMNAMIMKKIIDRNQGHQLEGPDEDIMQLEDASHIEEAEYSVIEEEVIPIEDNHNSSNSQNSQNRFYITKDITDVQGDEKTVARIYIPESTHEPVVLSMTTGAITRYFKENPDDPEMVVDPEEVRTALIRDIFKQTISMLGSGDDRKFYITEEFFSKTYTPYKSNIIYGRSIHTAISYIANVQSDNSMIIRQIKI